MRIEHRANVFCLIVSASTDMGRKRIGNGCWLYKAVEPNETVFEFGYQFTAYDDRMWIVVFVDKNDNQMASFFEEKNLLPIYDGNSPRSPDEVLRLENKRKKPDEGEV